MSQMSQMSLKPNSDDWTTVKRNVRKEKLQIGVLFVVLENGRADFGVASENPRGICSDQYIISQFEDDTRDKVYLFFYHRLHDLRFIVYLKSKQKYFIYCSYSFKNEVAIELIPLKVSDDFSYTFGTNRYEQPFYEGDVLTGTMTVYHKDEYKHARPQFRAFQKDMFKLLRKMEANGWTHPLINDLLNPLIFK